MNPPDLSGPCTHARVEIDAPIDEVWSVLVDVAGHDGWNPFTLRLDPPRLQRLSGAFVSPR